MPITTPAAVCELVSVIPSAAASAPGFCAEFGQAEIEDLDSAIFRDEDILGFQIAVNDSFFVRGGETLRDLYGVIDCFARGQNAVVEHRAKRFALEEFRDEKGRAVVLADVEYGENVWMVERRYRAGFLFEADEAIAFAREGFGEDFQRDFASEPRVARAYHFAHAACA